MDLDIKGFFDSIDHHLLLKALQSHIQERWVILYLQRWLEAPVQLPNGELQARTCGMPQGGVISPLLANLFLHYAFDAWMRRNHPDIQFERYADDAICLSRVNPLGRRPTSLSSDSGGRIVAEHRRQRPGSRSRQVIDGHWEGLLPQRQQREAERSLRDGNARCDQEQRPARSSELARPLAVYAELIREVAA